jgi:sec-independent protein translocase protein TatA
MDLSGPHIIILLAVVLLLFGSTRLPGAADALGKSMHIFKRSVKGLGDEDPPADKVTAVTALPPTAAPQPQPLPGQAAADATQQQLLDLQRQVADLQRQAGGTANGAVPNGAAPTEAQHTQQPF